VPRQAVVERAASALTGDRNHLELDAGGRRRPGGSQPVLGRMNWLRCGGVRGTGEPRTYSIGPRVGGRSSSEIQQVIISAGTR